MITVGQVTERQVIALEAIATALQAITEKYTEPSPAVMRGADLVSRMGWPTSTKDMS